MPHTFKILSLAAALLSGLFLAGARPALAVPLCFEVYENELVPGCYQTLPNNQTMNPVNCLTWCTPRLQQSPDGKKIVACDFTVDEAAYTSCDDWRAKAINIPTEFKSPLLTAELQGDINKLNQFGQGTSIQQVLGRMIKIGLGVVGSVALLMFIYGGVTMLLGSTIVGGGATKQDVLRAKGIITWAALGLMVVLASYAIVRFIFGTF